MKNKASVLNYNPLLHWTPGKRKNNKWQPAQVYKGNIICLENIFFNTVRACDRLCARYNKKIIKKCDVL